MRPLYETPDDLAKETAVVEAVTQRWDVEAKKLPLHYELDYALYQEGFLKCYLEIKCRDVASTAYKTLILSAHKVAQAKRLGDSAGVPAVLVVRYTDCDLWIALNDGTFLHQHGGRKDREDEQDMEPVAHIPVAKMRRL